MTLDRRSESLSQSEAVSRPLRSRRSSASGGRRGVGVLVVLILIIVGVLFVFGMFQNFMRGVDAQREAVFGGRRAFYLAESAINEAYLDVIAGMNDPASPWFPMFRVPLSPSYSRLETVDYDPVVTPTLYDESGVTIERVVVQFWKQRSFWGLAYEKHGILMIKAVVSIPRYSVGVIDIPIRRDVHKSWEVKVCLTAPPKPFDRMTLFMFGLPLLQQAKEDYDRLQGDVDANEKKIEENFDTAMKAWEKSAADFIQACKKSVDVIDKARDWARTCSLPFGMGRGKVKRQVEAKIQENLDKVPITEDRLRLIANSSPNAWVFPPDARSVKWPPHRTDGHSLRNPVYSVKDVLASGDLPYRTPDFPDPPSWSPSDRIDKVKKDWAWPGLENLAEPFRAWLDEYGRDLPPYESKLKADFERHQDVWKLVPNDKVAQFETHYLPKVVPRYWRFKAAYQFANEAAFKNRCVLANKAYLNGTYYIDGPFRADFATYRGMGVIVAAGNVELGTCKPEGDSRLVVVSGKTVFVGGSPRAAIMAPHATIQFGGSAVTGVAYERHHAWDDFSITYDPALDCDEGDGVKATALTVTVSPFNVANNFTRK